VRTRLLPLLVLAACQPPVSQAPTELPPDVALQDVTVRSFRGAGLELKATAPALAFDRTGPRAGQLRGGPVALELLRHGVTVTAREVVGDALLGDLTGLEVAARTRTGVELTSPRASYARREGAEGTASTDAGVVVRHPRLELTARSGRLDLATEEADLADVTSRLSLPASPPAPARPPAAPPLAR
jgi:hypothetical protein